MRFGKAVPGCGRKAYRPAHANDNQRGGWQSLACLANAVIGRLALPLVAETTIEFMRPGFDESRSLSNVDTTVSEGGRDTGRNSPEERSQRWW